MMNIYTKDFLEMLKSAYANLENHEEEINTLNVFPVPDGDTGTNMTRTFKNGLLEAQKSENENVGIISKSLSKGLLMGARGNSGVITSQIFRGFSKYVKDKEELSAYDVAQAFVEGAKLAYKAIIKPIEGTILTVIREGAWYANHDIENKNDVSPLEYFEKLVKYCKESLDKTPELLPALKEAGVVDSGGMGLYRIFEGFYLYFLGTPVVLKNNEEIKEVKKNFLGYECHFVVKLHSEYQKDFDTDIISKRLKAVGTNLDIQTDGDQLIVSIDTNTPGEVLTVAQRYGEFSKLNIENNMFENKEEKKPKKYGLISVCNGDGITKLFKELGVDVIISGGQTMNPSTKDFVDCVNSLENCDTVFVFPNNSNIILSATQARDIVKKDIIIVPTKTMQDGLSCVSIFDINASKETNISNMEKALSNIKTACVTYAVKDTSYEGMEVKQNDYISLMDKSIISSSLNLKDVCIDTIKKLMEYEDKELFTIIVGEGADDTITSELEKIIEENGQLEVQIINGGQKVYSYLFAIE